MFGFLPVRRHQELVGSGVGVAGGDDQIHRTGRQHREADRDVVVGGAGVGQSMPWAS